MPVMPWDRWRYLQAHTKPHFHWRYNYGHRAAEGCGYSSQWETHGGSCRGRQHTVVVADCKHWDAALCVSQGVLVGLQQAGLAREFGTALQAAGIQAGRALLLQPPLLKHLHGVGLPLSVHEQARVIAYNRCSAPPLGRSLVEVRSPKPDTSRWCGSSVTWLD